VIITYWQTLAFGLLLDKTSRLDNNSQTVGRYRLRAMGFISKTLKKGFFWSYPRTSWQWDVLCVLILVFIFLTPKSWFESRQLEPAPASQNLSSQTVLVSSDVAGAQLDRAEIERRVRTLTGHQEAQVVDTRERRDPGGKLIGYEVDIR
jgi:hypothetical protein